MACIADPAIGTTIAVWEGIIELFTQLLSSLA
jgi:hypothetical protein